MQERLVGAMRDDVDALARDVQRARTTKDERITANTVMRGAVQLLMDNYRFERGDVANREEELYRLREHVEPGSARYSDALKSYQGFERRVCSPIQ
jgi:hypothetical protein